MTEVLILTLTEGAVVGALPESKHSGSGVAAMPSEAAAHPCAQGLDLLGGLFF